MASPSSGLASAGLTILGLLGAGCLEGGNLAVSAGAPVTAALEGRVSDCGDPVAGAEVMVRVRQDTPEQSRPVDARIGPLTTGRNGSYFTEIGPPFAVPGQARVQLTVTASGLTVEPEEVSVQLELGTPPRDTFRIDTDLVTLRGFCVD